MTLGVEVGEVLDEAAALGVGDVGCAIGLTRASEVLAPATAVVHPIGAVDGVPGLVAQELHAPAPVTSFHLEHLLSLQAHEPRVRQVERDREAGDSLRCEPVGREPDGRAEAEPRFAQLLMEFLESRLEPGAGDPEVEVAQAHLEKLLDRQLYPAGPTRAAASYDSLSHGVPWAERLNQPRASREAVGLFRHALPAVCDPGSGASPRGVRT
jgi:hypothetical protein